MQTIEYKGQSRQSIATFRGRARNQQSAAPAPRSLGHHFESSLPPRKGGKINRHTYLLGFAVNHRKQRADRNLTATGTGICARTKSPCRKPSPNPPIPALKSARLLDTLRTKLIACALHVAKCSQVPPAPARCCGRRISPVPVEEFRHPESVSLAHGGAGRKRSANFAPALGAGCHLCVLCDSRAALDAFFAHARQDAFLERVQRAADGFCVPLHSRPGGRADTSGACRAERFAIDSANVRRLFSRAGVRHRFHGRARGIRAAFLRAPRLDRSGRRGLHEPRAFNGSRPAGDSGGPRGLPGLFPLSRRRMA